jgi:CubicO group peptidase (beta-lactamase class C family)
MNAKWSRGLASTFTMVLVTTLPVPAATSTPAENLPPEPAPVIVKLSAEQIAAFRNYLISEQKQTGLPGLAVALVQPGQTLLLEGFGVGQVGGDTPVTVHTRFALGPATQAVNSLLLARLAEENILSLDAPATRGWDEFRLADPVATPKVTLRHLLGMMAGMPTRADNFLRVASATPTDLFSLLAQVPVAAQPGREFAYSDASVAAAGYLAVYAANKHHAPDAGLGAGYAALAKKELFEPLGMKDATFEPTENDATGHILDAQGAWKSVLVEPAIGGALRPALGLRASVNDVAEWLQVEITEGIGSDGKSFVLPAGLEERWRPAAADDKREYALGWATQHYRGIEIVTRQGEHDHQTELVAVIPQYRTAFALLTNGGGKEATVFLQDALLNLTDLLKETAAGQP